MPQSVQSFGARSTTSIATTRSRTSRLGSRKVKIRWYERRPILSNALFIDLQKGSYTASIFTLLESILQISLAIFDIYCLLEAAPGSKHSRNFGISFMFVYSGNQHVRRSLIAVASLLLMSAIYLFVSSIILMTALRKEHELKFRHWLRAMAIFIVLRLISIIYQSIVNDLFFLYHQLMLVLWLLLTIINTFTWLVVYSNYQELSDITRLEDMAKLKMSTLSSLNASRTFSHHSLDSTNPYGRYGGGGVGGISISGTGSLQPSPQIYHHSIVANQPLTIHESHQNINSSRPGTSNSGNVGIGGQFPPTPRSIHSSQNSLHQSYLQMYSNTLSQRSRQSSQASLSMDSMANSFPMHSYNSPQQQQQHQQQQLHQQQPSSSNMNYHQQQQQPSSRFSNQFGQTNFGVFGDNNNSSGGGGGGGGSYMNRNSNTPI